METKYDEYLEAKRALLEAEAWRDLPKGEKYDVGSTFKISVAHCEMKLTRAGQKYQGGQNYWESSKKLNAAIFTLLAQDPSIIERAIEAMRKEVSQKLIDSKAEVQVRLKEIEDEEASHEA